MSDFSEDPAAEFLQQEGDQLRELGIEDDQFAVIPPDQFTPVPASVSPVPPAAQPESNFDLSEFDSPAVAPAAAEPVASMGGLEEFEADVDLADQDAIVNGYADMGFSEPAIAQQPIHSITPSEEPESLAKWRDEKAATLQQQETDEQDATTAWAEKAKKELEDWYNRYNEQLEKVKNENRAAQDQFIEEMTDTKPGNEWEKVARFCDFNPKFSKNTKDVSRMRSLLLQLKQNPLVR